MQAVCETPCFQRVRRSPGTICRVSSKELGVDAGEEADDQSDLTARLSELHSIVLTQGEQLDHAERVPSDLIVPPPDLSLEAHALLADKGPILDLPDRSA